MLKRAEKPRLTRVERMMIYAAAAAIAAFGAFLVLFEKEWGAGLLRALLGLSGGATAGG
jgi:hypothetical protein